MVRLNKGERVTLEKENNQKLEKIIVGLGWDANKFDNEDKFDLDASVFLLTSVGKVHSDDDFIFYNQKVHPSGSVIHSGDNRTGSGDGDDETIKIDLTKIPEYCEKLAFVVTIDEAIKRMQNFGMVSNAYIHIVDEETGNEIARYDLSEDFSTETAIIIGEIYRHNEQWKFKAVGSGYVGGLESFCKEYGVEVE